MRRTLFLLALLGCDNSTSPPPEPPADECMDGLRSMGPWSVYRCSDGVRFSIHFDDRPLLTQAQPGIRVAGRLLTAHDAQDVIWRSADNGLVEEWRGLPGGINVQLSIVLNGPATLTMSVTANETPVDLEAIHLLDFTPGEGGLVLSDQAVSSLGQFIPGYFFASEPDGPTTYLGSPAATPLIIDRPQNSIRARWVSEVVLRPDRTVTTPSLSIRSGTSSAALHFAHTLTDPVDIRPTPRIWGWRSGPAFGPLVNTNVLLAQRDILRQISASTEPTILVDGLWYTAAGDWTPSALFPNGFNVLRESLLPAHLGLRWPILWVDADADLFSAEPTWHISADCTTWQCGQLDIRLPEVRAYLVQVAQILAQNVDALFLDLDPAPDARTRRQLVDALHTGAPGTYLSSKGDALFGAIESIDLAIARPWANPPTCQTNGPFGPRPADCADASQALTLSDAGSSEPPSLTLMAISVHQNLGHIRGGVGLDLGPVMLTDRPLGEARQAAMLAWLSGGPFLLGDPMGSLDSDRLAIVSSILEADLPTEPTSIAGNLLEPLSDWDGTGVAVRFNWSDQPRLIQPPIGLTHRLFVADDVVEIPPNDVGVWYTKNSRNNSE